MYIIGDKVRLLWDGLISIGPGEIGVITDIIKHSISSVPYEVKFGRTIVYLQDSDIEKVIQGGL